MQKHNLTNIENRLVNQLTAVKFLKHKLSRFPDSFEDRIFIFYLESGGAVNAAALLNDEGYRKEGKNGSRRYVSSDITSIIQENANNNEIDPAIRYIASEMVKRKNGYVTFIDLPIRIAGEAVERFDSNG